jgi:lipid-A-disaccharide synthase
VLILPGSRTQEVIQNLKMQLHAAAIILSRFPETRFVLGAFRPKQAQLAREMIAASGLPVELFIKRTPELMSIADCCLAVSGSVSLELLYWGRPTVVCYRISRLAMRVQKYFRRVKYITLVNLLNADELFPADLTPYDPAQPDAERVLFPEYLTCEDRAQQMADHVIGWLSDRGHYEQVVNRLKDLREKVGSGGASAQGAEYIVRHLEARPVHVPRPHFLPSEDRARLAQVRGLRPRGMAVGTRN